MKKKIKVKKILATTLACIMCISVFTMNIQAEEIVPKETELISEENVVDENEKTEEFEDIEQLDIPEENSEEVTEEDNSVDELFEEEISEVEESEDADSKQILVSDETEDIFSETSPNTISTIIKPDSIKFDIICTTLNINEEMTLTPILLPEDVTEKTITWISSNPEIASVEDGVVIAKKTGSATIIAKTINNLTATCEVAVFSNADSYQVGDIIKFGQYEQDGNMENGKEDIAWQILKVDGDRILVISKYALDCKTYHNMNTGITWEFCSLREWLNKDFMDEAFSIEERSAIPLVTIENKNNPYKGTAGGNDTEDQIFCLSLEEAESFFGDYNFYNDEGMWGYNQKLICSPTQFAVDNGATMSTITDEIYESRLREYGYSADSIGCNNAIWWLRSPGKNSMAACAVNHVGYAGASNGFSANGDYRANIAVRPALYIDFSLVNPESITLDITSASMKIDEELLLTPILLPENVTENNIIWTSSNPEVASVENGVVKAKSTGVTTITAETVNGLTATCEITVISNTNDYKVGDIIKFGKYEQDGNLENGKEDIEWIVLQADSKRLLIISKYVLDCKPYNTTKQDVTWETCALREWLNNDFKKESFNVDECSIIPTVINENGNNPKYGTDGGNNTYDQIFCISLEEMELYFGDYDSYDNEAMTGTNKRLLCEPTQYCKKNKKDHDGGRYVSWWLRTPGCAGSQACFASYRGKAGPNCYANNTATVCVRPALYIDFSMVNPESITLDKTSASMNIDEELLLTPTLLPENVTENNIMWTSSNSEVASVENGAVKAKSAGVTTITAKTVNGLTATCEITVFDSKEGIVVLNSDYFPDDYFRGILERAYDTNKDGLLNLEEIEKINEIVYPGQPITNFAGIEYFSELSLLWIDQTSLSAPLDVSQNKKLKVLRCSNLVGINRIDVSTNSELEELTCIGSNLETIVLGNNDNIKSLRCTQNNLTELDISGCRQLKEVYLNGNQGGGIYTDDENRYLSFDENVKVCFYTGEGIAIISDNFPDAQFREIVKEYDKDSDYVLSQNEIDQIKTIDCEKKNIGSLEGIEFFDKLEKLYCSNNHISSLDLNKNILLRELRCSHNMLNELDVSRNTVLNRLECDYNQLSSITIYNCRQLDTLYCDNNSLTEINTDDNVSLSSFICSNNNLKSLDVRKNTSLVSFWCNDNSLTGIDIRNNKSLRVLRCQNNQIKQLNVRNNTALFDLRCHYNYIKTLDISLNNALINHYRYGESGAGDPIGIEWKWYSTDVSQGKYLTIDNDVLLTTESKQVTELFNDISEKAWYKNAVQFVYNNDIMSGTGNSFSPNSPITREQFTQVLYNNEAKPGVSIDNPFLDVKNNQWYTNSVLWAKENGIASGKADGNFGIGNNITRQDLAKMLYSYAEYKGFDLTAGDNATDNYPDASKVSPYARKAMNWAVTQGIMSGKGDGRLDPAGKATRAECASMMMRLLLKNSEEESSEEERPNYKVGDIITFGSYEQDGNIDNGSEDIEWEILKVEQHRILVVSKYSLEKKRFHDNYTTSITWENCSLRKWMNGDFYDNAFSNEEKQQIDHATIVNANNPRFGTAGGKTTTDYVFCLSLDEVINLIGYRYYNDKGKWGCNQKLVVPPTKYAINQGANYQTITQEAYDSYYKNKLYTSDIIGCQGTNWYLRTPGPTSDTVCFVSYDGTTDAYYSTDIVFNDGFAVRPAIYINIE